MTFGKASMNDYQPESLDKLGMLSLQPPASWSEKKEIRTLFNFEALTTNTLHQRIYQTLVSWTLAVDEEKI